MFYTDQNIANAVTQIKSTFNNCQLTSKEKACLRLLLSGHSAKKASNKLGISPKTVEYYTLRLKDKFDVLHVSELREQLLVPLIDALFSKMT